MAKSFFISPTAQNAGLTSVSLGLLRALDEIGVRVGFFKPITQVLHNNGDHSVHFVKEINNIANPAAISLTQAQALLSRGDKGLLMEQIIENFHQTKQNHDVIIIEGIVPKQDEPYTAQLNNDIANSLDAEIILLVPLSIFEAPLTPKLLDTHIHTAMGTFAANKKNIIGCILNKVGYTNKLPEDSISISDTSETEKTDLFQKQQFSQLIENTTSFNGDLRLIGQIPLVPQLQAPRIIDIAQEFNFKLLDNVYNTESENNISQMYSHRVHRISICARSVSNLVSALTPGCLLVTPGDRNDVLLAACMAVQNGTPLAGVILTGDYQPDPQIISLCLPVLLAGFPILCTKGDTFSTAIKLSKLENKVPLDDIDRMDKVMSTVAMHLDTDWLKQHCEQERATRLSPPAFRFLLSERARAAKKTIVLPEGNEPRTICAAVTCHERNLARCILIGKELEIQSVAQAQGVKLPPELSIIDPDIVREQYVTPMTELRKSKGVSPQMALAMLEDNVVLATMMVALDEVDGLVSGAVHTTANTVRPALQLIKTTPIAKVVSSVFFMCLPEQVLVYGDCAINPDPNAEQLADIAIQSADSARAFGIEPKVAMISYSTGKSGTGDDVDKVREATRLAKAMRPDLIIDGPLQYDAAAIENVAKKKAPDSPVAGQATVFIFPDLNTGNTTYKAVQRSANVISIGPMLQGLRKPVNDLSRGALVEDIIFTIALTAVQATQT